MARFGVIQIGANARKMLNLDKPALDWCSLGAGLGIKSGRAETSEDFVKLLRAALARTGPFLVEAVMPQSDSSDG
ncbi:hypothetical protein [Rhizobium lentis]|uniref:Thiamine pyrophosphate enzyme TPP-binding domain-containing protein n=1 Tax=Rhizobium lentis TaxID=1138194 RepID=A0ABS7ICL9_9HYPH|nr:hypothetical protein [Rhizobium lentis]MBX5088338.1 hypothetical protein [Rhizobium lentis]